MMWPHLQRTTKSASPSVDRDGDYDLGAELEAHPGLALNVAVDRGQVQSGDLSPAHGELLRRQHQRSRKVAHAAQPAAMGRDAWPAEVWGASRPASAFPIRATVSEAFSSH